MEGRGYKMKPIEELGISPTPWSLVYDPDNGVPFRIECTRPKGLSNRVVDDFDGLLVADAHIMKAAPRLYEACRMALSYIQEFPDSLSNDIREELEYALAEASGDVSNGSN